jgi:hypothetical protein
VKLEGSLDAFSLRDIFQLLSFTKKSGGLHLRAGESDGVVYFAGGAVNGASSDLTRQTLARRLLGTGSVSEESLAEAVRRAQGDEAVGVARALLETEVMAGDVVAHAAREQTVEAVFDLLGWDGGDFAFAVDQVNPDDVGVALTVEDVIAEADTRRGAWEELSQTIPSPGSVVAMRTVPGDDLHVSREEWGLLAIIDGARTVVDLAELSGRGQYAVVSALAELVRRGLLEVRDDSAQDQIDHLNSIQRLQNLLAPLESATFQPIASAEPATHVNGLGEPSEASQSGLYEPGGPGESGESASPSEYGEPAPPATELADESSVAFDEPTVGDVVPARPEPFLPRRQPEYAEAVDAAAIDTDIDSGIDVAATPINGHVALATVGNAAIAAEQNVAAIIERDPSVNRSLMLRLIAGVRGL